MNSLCKGLAHFQTLITRVVRVRETIRKWYSKVNVLNFRTTTLHNCTQYVLISAPVTNEIWPTELKFTTAHRRKLNLPSDSIYSLPSRLPRVLSKLSLEMASRLLKGPVLEFNDKYS